MASPTIDHILEDVRNVSGVRESFVALISHLAGNLSHAIDVGAAEAKTLLSELVDNAEGLFAAVHNEPAPGASPDTAMTDSTYGDASRGAAASTDAEVANADAATRDV